MAEKSSYLRYLPPVLWENEPSAPEFSLGAALRIFEKILTGIEDDVTIQHGDHAHEPITALIACLHRLFDPWQTPQSFLPWLASWVALEFPTLQGQLLWDEYQRRKVTSEIAQSHRLRGLKVGLNQYLNLWAAGQTRPRVALDDGSRLLVTRPQPGRMAPVVALVSQGPVLSADTVVFGNTVVSGGTVLAEGLVRPWCVAAGSDGSLFVGDIGVPDTVLLQLKSRVWRISAAGHYDLAGTPPRPQPLMPDTRLTRVAALAVRPPQAGQPQPETLYILDSPGRLYALPTPYTGTPTALAPSLEVRGPVAMSVDLNGDLLVLDRGSGPGTPNPPNIITVRPTTSPMVVNSRPLQKVIEPLSLLVQSDGKLIVGDGREQASAQPVHLAGNLVLVDRSTTPAWTETVLLPLLPPSNPLVAPTAITRSDDTHLYVLDAGLKPFVPPNATPFILTVADPAGVYRVNLGDSPTVTRVTQVGHLVFPTGMVANGGRLLICDPGQIEVRQVMPVWSRLLPFRFGVVVHFANSRLPSDASARRNVQRQVVGNISSIVEQQKPAHTLWDLITSIS
jgi:phage tail-like protein